MNINQTLKPLLGSPVSYDLFGDMSGALGGGLGAVSPASSASPSSPTPPGGPTTGSLPEEKKKQERAIKNRQSAQASRERKRQYMSELEQERGALMAESRNLRARVGTLETEKSLLVGELSTLKREFEQLKQLVLAGKVGNGDATATATTTTTTSAVDTTGTSSITPLSGHVGQHYHCVNAGTKYDSKMDGRGANTGLSSLRFSGSTPNAQNVVAGLGLSATQWVWRGLPSESLTNVTSQSPTSPPTHSPSVSPLGSDHLLVMSPGGVGPMHGQNSGLNHVMRLRLRYRRSPIPVNRPLTTAMNTNNHSPMTRSKLALLQRSRSSPSTTVQRRHRRLIRRMRSGSVPGKNILAPVVRVSKGKRTLAARQTSRPHSLKMQMRQRMTMIWDQIINGSMSTKQNGKTNKRRFPK